jgi:hypothetical protein
MERTDTSFLGSRTEIKAGWRSSLLIHTRNQTENHEIVRLISFPNEE